MKLTNGILVLGPGDLTKEAREKKFKNVTYTDIAWSLEPFKQASIVLLVDDVKGKMKVMKSKYEHVL
jgi:hypothetical protein